MTWEWHYVVGFKIKGNHWANFCDYSPNNKLFMTSQGKKCYLATCNHANEIFRTVQACLCEMRPQLVGAPRASADGASWWLVLQAGRRGQPDSRLRFMVSFYGRIIWELMLPGLLYQVLKHWQWAQLCDVCVVIKKLFVFIISVILWFLIDWLLIWQKIHKPNPEGIPFLQSTECIFSFTRDYVAHMQYADHAHSLPWPSWDDGLGL